ncbi:hypothetical protein AB0M02_16145 [Actinoplanes sp. NPDC051861]|uniref:hypothetical protein n=1 Tax=Actinoplanes sp. NPDC051861 TaxID=3155170 RepID=UPI00343677BC
MTGVALAATLVLVIAVFWVDRDLPSGEAPGDVVRVGVVEGQSVAGYLANSRHEMALLTDPTAPSAGETWALVSLESYAAPARLAALLAGAAVAQVYARVPLPETRTQVSKIPVWSMPDDVTAGMLDAALVRDQEQADYLRLSRALKGSGRTEERLRATYEAAARVAAREAAAYRAGCVCTFAAVVRGGPEALDQLAHRGGVRSVDPAPEVRQLDRTEFRPPLPEEEGTVEADPSGSPVPSPGSPVATGTPPPIPSSIGTHVTSTSPENSGGESLPAVLPSEEPVAVPSAPDASPAREGFGASSGASSGASGR